MIDFHGVILADEVAAQLGEVARQIHSAASDPHAPEVRLLLCGRPGVGKTAVTRALAKDARVKAVPVSATAVRGLYLGQSAHLLQQLFERARASEPALLMFDAFEHIFTRRDDFRSSTATEECVMELLLTIDGLARNKRGPAVCMAGEVAAIDLVDPSVLSRIPTRIELPVPDDECRAEILRRAAARMEVPLGPDEDATIADWSSELRGSTPRELESFIRHIAQNQLAAAEERPKDAVSIGTPAPAVDAPPPAAVQDPLVEKLQAYARLIRMGESDERVRMLRVRTFLFKGTTDVAMRFIHDFAAAANLPCCVFDGPGTLAVERSNPGSLQARLDEIVRTGPGAVIITDVERLVAERGTPQYERAMATAWVAIRNHYDAQHTGVPYVPLIFTSTDVQTLDHTILVRVAVTLELPSAAPMA